MTQTSLIESFEIEDLGSLHHYRTEIPNILFSMKLDPLAFKTYCVLKMTAGDRGSCFKSNTTLMEEVGCSKPSLLKAKQELSEAGLIIITKRANSNGGNAPDLIQIVDLWNKNMQMMMEKKKKQVSKNVGGGKEILPGGVKKFYQGGKNFLPKQEHKEQKQKEQQQAASPSAAVFSCLKEFSLEESAIKSLMQFPEDRVKAAVAFVKGKGEKATNIAGLLIWHCKEKAPPLPELTKEEILDNNKSWALKEEAIGVTKKKRFKLIACNNYCEVVVGGQVGAYHFDYSDPKMIEKVKEKLGNV